MTNKKINISMEYCKMLAAIFVVLIHVPFPGKTGQTVACLARFAVPVFFAVTGYFSYLIKGNVLLRRMKRIFKINVVATLIYLMWNVIYTVFVSERSLIENFSEKLSLENTAKWLIININPFSGHLWYLAAILSCYVVLWCYVTFFGENEVNYKPLYIVSVCLIAFQIMVGTNAMAVNIDVHYTVYRNALFLGLPMFSMGLFIREYHSRIAENFRLTVPKEILLIFSGMALSLLQWFGFGKTELPVGMIVTVFMLMMLMVSYPSFTENKVLIFVASRLGNISLSVYIIHCLYSSVLKTLSKQCDAFSFIDENTYWYPLLIIVLSVISGILFDVITDCLNKIKKEKTERLK